jgi:hypothetical protein
MINYLKERDHWYPVSTELMASYQDGSHIEEWACGTLIWHKNGDLHRIGDKPARIYADGSLGWHKNGKCHRDGDKPAFIGAGGTLVWYKNGEYHRDGDKPAVIEPDGSLVWYKNGKRHRVTGPAVMYLHEEEEYWIHGVNITTEVNDWLRTKKYWYPFTPEHQVEFLLTFG